MKVILLSSVPKVGAVNEAVEVSDGYAQNYLIPQGLAKLATDKNITEHSKHIEEAKRRDEEHKKAVRDALSRANNTTLSISREANELGTLFSAVSARDIAEALEETQEITIDESYVVLDTPLKEIGTHQVKLEMEDSRSTITVDIQGK